MEASEQAALRLRYSTHEAGTRSPHVPHGGSGAYVSAQVVTSSGAEAEPGVQSDRRRAASSGGASRRAENSGAGRRLGLAGAWRKRADAAARASGTRSASSGLVTTRMFPWGSALLASEIIDRQIDRFLVE